MVAEMCQYSMSRIRVWKFPHINNKIQIYLSLFNTFNKLVAKFDKFALIRTRFSAPFTTEITKLFAPRKKWSVAFEFRLSHVTIWSAPIRDVPFLMWAKPWEHKETDCGMRWMCTKNFPPFWNDMWSLMVKPNERRGRCFSRVLPGTF